MNKKLAIVAIACVVSIILGGLNNSVLFGTEYLTTKPGYSYTVGEAVDWWDCNWSYAKKITVDHTMVQADQTNFPVLLYESSDADLAAYAQSDGGDIAFVDSFNLTQYDHELEKYVSSTGEMVAWVEIASLSSNSDTILYMYYGNPDCANQWNISGTWNSNYKMVQHLSETSDPHYDSTANDNDGSTSGSVTQDTTYVSHLDGCDYFPDGTGVINFGNASSLASSSITLEAWVKDPPVPTSEKSKNSISIVDKKHEQVTLSHDRTLHVKRTLAAESETEVIFVALYSPGVLIQDMNVEDSSVFSGTYESGLPHSKEEQNIENVRKILPIELQQLPMLAYSKPFSIDDETSVQMQFKNIGWNNVFSNGKISYLVISKEGSYDYECTTHWNNNVGLWNRFSAFFDFIKSLFSGDKKPSSDVEPASSDEEIFLPPSIKEDIENGERIRVIIRYNNDEESFSKKTDFLQSVGFELSAELGSEGIVAGFIDKSVFKNIKNDQDIEGIYVDDGYNVLLEESLPLIHFPETISEYNLTGDGIKICILDTGVDPEIVEFSYGYDFVNDDTDPSDDHGHGTQVAAVLKSIAPNSELVVAKVIGSDGSGYESDVLEGLKYCIEQNPDIILFSIGSIDTCSGFCDSDFVADMCNDAVNNGIFVVAASGNDGDVGLKSPACGSNVFSVGATDDNDDIADFSNVNPTLDLFAPGVDITSFAGVGSGTSFSAPHVAAAAALILENESLNPFDLKYRLRSTGNPIWHEYNDTLQINISRLNIYNAVKNIKTYEPYDYSWWWQCEVDNTKEYLPLSDTLYERYQSGDSGVDAITDVKWRAQSFTIGNTGANVDHDVTSVKLKMYRVESPGTLTVSIQGAAAAPIRPDMSDLCVGTIDADTFTTDASGDWYEITFGSPATLSASTQYYIVSRVLGGDRNNYVNWLMDTSSPTYTGGFYAASENGGKDWTTDLSRDFLFEEYGLTLDTSVDTIRPYIQTSYSLTINATSSGAEPDEVTLWYRYDEDNVSFGDWIVWDANPNPDPVAPWSWPFLFENGSGYYEFYSIANKSGQANESAPGSADAICQYSPAVVTVPTVITNASTGVEETNATLWGYLSSNGGADTTCGFWYDTTSGGTTNNESAGVTADKSTFSYAAVSLTAGQLYYFKAWANNSAGFNGTANEKTFLTKPQPPSGLNAQANSSTMIFLNWTVGTGANSTYVERNASGDTVWARGAGTMVYNGSALNYEDSGLTEDESYYYQAWSYTNWTYNPTLTQWSDSNASAGNWTDLTDPAVSFSDPTPDNDQHRNDTWINVSLTSSDNGDEHYAFLDFNKTLVGWWMMDYASSSGEEATVYDNSSYGNDGTAIGNANQTDNGYFGKGFTFDNTGDYIDLNVEFNFSGNYSVAAWIKENHLESNDAFVSQRGNDAGDFFFRVNSLGRPIFRRWNGTGSNYKTWYENSPTVQIGTWTHLAAVWNGTAVQLYMDGVLLTPTHSTGSAALSSSNLSISDTTDPFNGTIDEVLIFNRSLSLSEIQSLYNASATQYNHNFTDLPDGVHNFTGYAVDRAGNENSTEFRNVTIDTIKPSVEFIAPTPSNGSTTDTFVHVNISSSDTNQHYVFNNFNNSLVGWWRMDDVSDIGEGATVTDLSSYGNDGTAQDNANQTDNGFYGKGFSFDGNGDKIDLGNPDSLNNFSDSMSISAWIYLKGAAATDWQSIVNKENWDPAPHEDDSYLFNLQYSTKKPQFGVYTTNDVYYAVSSTGIDLNTWTHIVGTYDGSEIAIYINGTEKASNSASGNINSSTIDVGIGGSTGTSNVFNGAIDEVLIFNRSLSLSEIQSLYNATAYQYDWNFTGLSTGNYTFTGYAVDRAGNKNNTETRWRNITAAAAITVPIVNTNVSTGVEETNATLWGYLSSNGSDDTTCGFWWDTTSGGTTNNQSLGVTSNLTEFSHDATSLTEGQLYFFKAWANNSVGFNGTANEKTFLTKPQIPTSFTATAYNKSYTQINLSWTAGTGANNTVVVRQRGDYPSDRTDGTTIYNGTGTSVEDTGLKPGVTYYYRAWSWTNWTYTGTEYQHWSDSYGNASNITLKLTMLNCSTDAGSYGNGATVTFSAWVNASIDDTVVLLIANSTSNLENATYSSRGSCIANSSNTVISSRPQTITATMTASSNTSWYAKIYSLTSYWHYMYENTSAWNKTYNGGSSTGSDMPYTVSIDNNDKVYVAGYGINLNGSANGDWWIMSFNGSTGVRDWNKTFHGGSGADVAYSINTDSNNNVYVVGSGTNLNGSTNLDAWIMSFNGTTGVRDWNKSYTGSGTFQYESDVFRSVTVDNDDNVYATGFGGNLNGTGSWDWWIMRFNSTTGTREWNKTYSAGAGEWGYSYSVTTDNNNDVYVVGVGSNLNDSGSGSDWWIMSFNGTTGVRDWNYTYNSGEGGADTANSIAVDSNNNVYVVGYGTNLNSSSSGKDWWIMRFNGSTGVRDWNKTYSAYDSSSYDIANYVDIDSNDNVYVVGIGDDLNDPTSLDDWWIKRYNSSGVEDTSQWNITYSSGNSEIDQAYSVVTDSNDNVYVVGIGADLNGSSSSYDWWIKKFEYFTGNFSATSSTPIVITNASTGVEETNATLHGYLQSNGGEDCTVRFEYGTTTAYGTNTTNQTKTTGDEFSNGTGTALNPGTLYHYRAYAENSLNTDTGNDSVFLTKPQAPSSFTAATNNQTQIDLSWTAGDGANNTYIVRKTGTYPSDRTDGTNVYNDTGSSYSDTGLDQKQRYFYRAWSYTSWINGGTTYNQWSDSYGNATAATTTINLINCSTDKSIYGDGDTVTFSARVDADVGSTVVLLIANSVSNLSSSSYSNKESCIAYSINTVITSQPQTIAATMSASGTGTTWYAKVCDDEGRNSYMYENTTAWNKTYNGNLSDGSDIAYSVGFDSNDNVYVVGYGYHLINNTSTSVGSAEDWWIKKFDAAGNEDTTIWNQTFDSGSDWETWQFNNDFAYSVALDSNNSVYVVGRGEHLVGSSNYDWWIMRFNGTTGAQEWNLSYTNSTNNDEAYSVATDSNDNVYIVGLQASGIDDWWIKKFDSSGTEDTTNWNKTFDGAGAWGDDIAYSVAVDSSDNVVVVGHGDDLVGDTNDDWWIMYFNGSTGVKEWEKSYNFQTGGPRDDRARSVAIDSNDNIYVAGYGKRLLGTTHDDWCIKKFNSTGSEDTTNWNKSYSSVGSNDDHAYSVAIDSTDNVYVVGYAYDLNGSSDDDWWIKCYNSTGSEYNSQWNNSYDGNGGNDEARSVAIDSNDNVYVVGYGWDLNSSDSNADWWIKKFEYFTGNFSVVNETKQILTMTQATYSLEINSASTTLTGYINSNSVSTSIDTDWHYVALTFDGSNMYLYKDGEEKTSGSSGGSITYPGTIPDVTAGTYLTGHLDELRISSTRRSSAWINTTFQNLNDPESFATFGSAVGVLSTWTYRKKITFNSAMIDEDLTNFPVLIYNASDTDLKNNALSSGNDIIFLNSSASENWRTETWRSKLDHEIEKYDSSTGELVAWVNVTSISSSTDTEIYLYYGNTLCTTNRENPAGVWDGDYICVQHMSESSGTLYDSTIYGKNATSSGDVDYNSSAIIDGAYDFNNEVDSEFNILNCDFNLNESGYTFSAWVNIKNHPTGDWESDYIAMDWLDASNILRPVFHRLDSDTWRLGFYTRFEGNSRMSYSQSSDPSDFKNKTLFITCSWDTTNQMFYINKSREDIDSTGGDLYGGLGGIGFIGFDVLSPNGTIDEVRVSKTCRSWAYINASYETIANSSTFVTFGDQEIQNIAPILSNPSPSDGATDQSLTPTLSITAHDLNADCLNISWRSNSSGTWQTFGSISSSATNRFGYDTAGSSYDDINQTIRGSTFTCPANGTADTIYVYTQNGGSVGNPLTLKTAVYYASNNTLLATSQETSTEMAMESPGWVGFTFSSPPSFSAGEQYYLVMWANTSAGSENYAYLYYDTLSLIRRGANQPQTYNGFPDPWSPTSENRVYSIYCTYNTTCLSNGTYYMDNLNFSGSNTTYYWSVNCTDIKQSDTSLWTNATYSFTTMITINQIFGGSGNDRGYSVQQTSDSGYIITGYSQSYGGSDADVWLIKTDSSGTEEWNYTFGGSSNDIGYSVQQTSDSGYIITGYSQSYGGSDMDVWLIKTDSSGTEEWNYTFGGSDVDIGYSVQQTSDSGYIITGYSQSYAGADQCVWLIKTDSSGTEEWNYTFGGIEEDVGYSVQQTSDSGYIITGYSQSYGGSNNDVWLIKTDSSGTEEWNYTFGGSLDDSGKSAQQTSDSGYIIAGTSKSYGGSDADVWLIKTDSSGTEEWNYTFGGSSNDVGYSVQQTSDSGYIITGYSQSYGGGDADVWLIKTNETGVEQWNYTFGGSLDDSGESVQQTSDSGYIITGYSKSYGGSDIDVWLIKTDQNGNIS